MGELPEITVFVNGPLKLKGSFVIRDAAGRAFDLSNRGRVALCRCGQSQTKPFCDGSHKRSGFQSEVEVEPPGGDLGG